MPEFAWPWVLLALPLPWIAARWLPAAPDALRAALRVPFVRAFAAMGRPAHARRIAGIARWFPLLGWLLLCIAAARPQHVGDVAQPPRSGRDLLLAVDLSGSMGDVDMRVGDAIVDRLTAVKAVLGDFLARREGDRVGLILFGSQAFSVTPLTFDRETVRQQLLASEVGIAGRETAIGDAIALAVKRMRTQPATAARVLVLLTDGVSNTGAIAPLDAARLAASEHVRIHTIGFGGGAPPTRMFGIVLPDPDEDIGEETLAGIAKATGGRTFRARDTESLARIYDELDRIEPTPRAGRIERPRGELYPLPLAAALLVALLATGARAIPLRRAAA